ncbi:MAG TPA: aspartyl/asparaginyl beta-hydroxylase domain-containing protein [Woeseiaceae bacterium]|nr:aspartyl/asparaginyl beta-hydroxylase domain-containing protein [Woeseiaceae bacterium]
MDQQSVAGMVAAAEDALRRGDTGRAFDILSRAESVAPGDASVHLSRALVYRSTGDSAAALESLDTVLALEPRNFLALLSKGFLLEQQGLARKAATVYRSAIAVAPPTDRVPPALAGALTRARQAVAENSKALRAHLEENLAEFRTRFGTEDLDRFDESVDILTGKTRAYVQQPLLLHYPRLPAIPFFDRELFPWLAELEAQTGAIQEELGNLLEGAGTEPFAPYIAYPPGAPLDQWSDLNHSRRWSSFFFWRDGVRQDEACARCPRTAAALEALPMARQSRLAPTAMFSALEAHTEIPPHTGSTNIRAIVHLPLVLPGPCRFRVGNVTREWRMNEAWAFDDTIEHQAWNDNDGLRVILIFDVWNPFLSEAERSLVTEMLRARSEFQAMDPVSGTG